jgi:hypothetical protein
MASDDSLRCEIEDSKDDEFGNKTKVVKCHGKLVSDTTAKLRETVKPLLLEGGRIVVDLGDVEHLEQLRPWHTGQPQGLRHQTGSLHSRIRQDYAAHSATVSRHQAARDAFVLEQQALQHSLGSPLRQ